MKRNIKVSLVTIAIIGIMCVPMFALTGTVVSVLGKVEVQSDSGWTPLKSGDSVQSGKVISTGFRSQAIIQIAGSSVIVNQLSRLTLEQLTETDDTHSSEVFIDLGSISADVQASQNKRVGFVVNTPVATSSVRGTQFTMDVNTLRVNRGLVDFNGKKGRTVSVTAGSISRVGSRENASTPFISKVYEALGNTAEQDAVLLTSVSTESLKAATEVKTAKAAVSEVYISIGN